MVDEVINAAPVVTPSVETAAPASASAEVVAQSPVESAPVVAPTVVEAAPVVVEPTKGEPAKSTDLLQPPEKSVDAEKPADVTPEGNKPAEIKTEEPTPLPTYEPFVLPEGVTVDNERLDEFTKMLGEFEGITKADHAEAQKFGQQLVDYHVAETNKTIERLNESYVKIWDKQKEDWKDDFRKDPEIGGNRQETTLEAAHKFIRTHGGTPEQQQELYDVLISSGLANHKAVIRTFAKASANMAEGKPLPPPQQIVSKTMAEKLYGTK